MVNVRVFWFELPDEKQSQYYWQVGSNYFA